MVLRVRRNLTTGEGVTRTTGADAAAMQGEDVGLQFGYALTLDKLPNKKYLKANSN